MAEENTAKINSIQLLFSPVSASLRAPAQLAHWPNSSAHKLLNWITEKVKLSSWPRVQDLACWLQGGITAPLGLQRCRKWVYPPLTVWCVLKRLWSRLRQNNYASIRLIISGLGGGRGAAAAGGKWGWLWRPRREDAGAVQLSGVPSSWLSAVTAPKKSHFTVIVVWIILSSSLTQNEMRLG